MAFRKRRDVPVPNALPVPNGALPEGVSQLPEATFGLDDVLKALSADLKKAHTDAVASGPFGLYFSEAEVELQFTVAQTRDKAGNLGINFKVFGVGLDAGGSVDVGASSETVHRIELTLVPGSAEKKKERAPGFPTGNQEELEIDDERYAVGGPAEA